MLALLLFLAICSAGSVLGAAVFQRKYGEILPISCSVIVLLLFLCGIFGHLGFGVILIVLLTVGIYILSIVWMIRKKNYREVLYHLFTPGLCVFTLFALAFLYLDYGLLSTHIDEFTHWTDIVKVMVIYDDFGTNVLSQSTFPTYPPGTALFEYFFQKISFFVSGDNHLSEWKLFYSFHIFLISYFIPFFEKGDVVTHKRFGTLLSGCLVILLAPMIFYSNIYSATLVDPALGILSGIGFAMIFCSKKKDMLYSVQVLLLGAVLVLIKDAGLVFAVFLVFAYAWDLSQKQKALRSLKIFGCAVLAVAIPKALWKFEIATSGANSFFPDHVSLSQFVKLLMSGEETYHKTVIENFYKAFLTRTVTIGDTGIQIAYPVLTVLSFSLLIGIWFLFSKRESQDAKPRKTVVYIIMIQFFVYVIGLCITYVLNFAEFEAVEVASFSRYIDTMFLEIWIFAIVLLLTMRQKYQETKVPITMFLLFMVILSTRMEYVYNLSLKKHVESSIENRQPYDLLSNVIAEKCEDNAHIYIVTQEDAGFDYMVLRYDIRPNISNAGWTWSIGKSFYEGDIWTREISAEQWMDELVAEYDYVALYKLNEYFYQEFSYLFENPEYVTENAVYRVDKDKRLLERCE